jgi:hypothetical protein
MNSGKDTNIPDDDEDIEGKEGTGTDDGGTEKNENENIGEFISESILFINYLF